MAVDTVEFVAGVKWAQSLTNTGFDESRQSGTAYSSIRPTVIAGSNRLYFTSQTIAASGTLTLNCQSLTDALGQAIVATRIYGIWVEANGAGLRCETHGTNGLVFPWNDASDAITIDTHGELSYCSTTSTVVDATHKQLLFTNVSGAVGTAVKILLLLGQ